MTRSRLVRCLVVAAALGLASCSELPQQGFATRYLGGSLGPTLSDQFDTASDFAGTPLHGRDTTRRGPPRDACEATAYNRSQDILNEGFDEGLQAHVYDAVLADCRAWAKRH